jgi:hypothetical protein
VRFNASLFAVINKIIILKTPKTMKPLKILFFLFPSLMLAQLEVDTSNATVTFTKVYNVDHPKNLIYQKTQEWLAINYKNANEVIKLNTPKKIVAKGYFVIDYINSTDFDSSNKVFFTTIIAFKENKYKISFTDYILKTSTNIQHTFEDFYFSSDFEHYKKTLKQEMEAQTNPQVIKQYKKLFKDENQMRQMYNAFIAMSKNVVSQITTQTNQLAKSMYNYINTKTKDDW